MLRREEFINEAKKILKWKPLEFFSLNVTEIEKRLEILKSLANQRELIYSNTPDLTIESLFPWLWNGRREIIGIHFIIKKIFYHSARKDCEHKENKTPLWFKNLYTTTSCQIGPLNELRYEYMALQSLIKDNSETFVVTKKANKILAKIQRHLAKLKT